MSRFYYKSAAPAVVAILQEFYDQRKAFDAAATELSIRFGAPVGRMRDITTLYVSGAGISKSSELDVHWRRPNEYGFRTLRLAAKVPKGTPKEERVSLKAEHERLQEMWATYCPKAVQLHDYWERLNVNTSNLLFCGGSKFMHAGVAYFELGFQINEASYHAQLAAGKPTNGWIEGAVEILPSEYTAAVDLMRNPS